jgi:hypothetical protein
MNKILFREMVFLKSIILFHHWFALF